MRTHYRILKNLSSEGKIANSEIGNLLDQACLILAQIYKAGRFHVIKHINNNFNMYLISRVVEELLGKETYSSEEQELSLTGQSLATAMEMTPGFVFLFRSREDGVCIGNGCGLY